jgi:hypothetical protein
MEKKDYTLEELKEQYEALGKKIKAKEQDEKAKLAAEKETRKKLIEVKEQELWELKKDFIKDYGSYNATRTIDMDADPFLSLWKLLG